MPSYLHYSKRLLSYFKLGEHLDPLARKNLTHHVRASFYEGIFAGGCANCLSAVAKKYCDASNNQVKWLFSASAIGMYFAVLLPMILRGASKVRQQVLLVSLRNAVVLSIPLLYFLAGGSTDGHPPGPDSLFTHLYIAAAMVATIFAIAPVTSRAGLSMEMYPDSHRMQCLGACSQVQVLTTVCSFFVTAPLLDQHPTWFWWLFPAFALFSFVGLSHYRGMRSPLEAAGQTRFLAFTPLDIWRGPLHNRRFLLYQLVFSLGGLPNLMVMPLYLIFNTDRSNANLAYSDLAWISLIVQATNFLTVSGWARILDRFPNPFVGRGILMIVWTLHPIVYTCAAFFFAMHAPLDGNTQHVLLWILFGGALLSGTLEAGGNLNWLLGSTYFAGPGEASLYSGAHMVFNATRALIGPLLGIGLFDYFSTRLEIDPWVFHLGGEAISIRTGFFPVFLIASAMMFIAAVFQFVLRWHYGPMALPAERREVAETDEEAADAASIAGTPGVVGAASVVAGAGAGANAATSRRASQRIAPESLPPGSSH